MPKQEKLAQMKGPGRVLGDGKIVQAPKAKDKKVKDDDDEYKPNPDDYTFNDSEEYESDKDEDLTNELISGLDADGYIHVMLPDGGYEKVRQDDEEEKAEDVDARFAEVQGDKRFELNRTRAGVRLAVIIKRASAEGDSKDGKIYDFDDLNARAGSRKLVVQPCKEGMYRVARLKNGKVGFKQYTPEQLALLKELPDDGSPCECDVCTVRRVNDTMIASKPPGSSRSGKKRGWGQYGEGQVLGESGDIGSGV